MIAVYLFDTFINSQILLQLCFVSLRLEEKVMGECVEKSKFLIHKKGLSKGNAEWEWGSL